MSSIPLSMTFVVGVSENDSDVNDSKLTGYHTFYQVLSFTAILILRYLTLFISDIIILVTIWLLEHIH